MMEPVSQIQGTSTTRFPGKGHTVIASAAKQSMACTPEETWIASAQSRYPTRNDKNDDVSAQHRQLGHIIAMANAALENGALEFNLEAARRADAALGREGAAEHGAAVRKTAAAETAVNQFLHRQQVVERAFLVQHPRAADPCMRTQDHLIPMAGHVLEFPQHRCDRLVAHLLGDGDAVGFHFPVGVVGASADEDAALPADQDEFDLATGLTAADFDAVLRRQPTRGDPIVDRGGSRPGDTDRFEF